VKRQKSACRNADTLRTSLSRSWLSCGGRAGAPWDHKQTSSVSETICHKKRRMKSFEAIDSGDPSLLCEELGDLLLQVVFQLPDCR